MLNILIPIAGKSSFFNEVEYQFPKPLIEIKGKSMIEMVIKNLETIKEDKKFIFIIKSQECDKYHIDLVLKLLVGGRCEIIKLGNDTKGAACSSLMAIEHIDNDEELLICNGDQILEQNFNEILNTFRRGKTDAGVICIESIHPRWSYVRIDKNKNIIETAEKKPISKNAIAGFYYFRTGKMFVSSAMSIIRKDANTDGNYYIAPTLNEMILLDKKIRKYDIDSSKYHSFYSPQKIKEFENNC